MEHGVLDGGTEKVGSATAGGRAMMMIQELLPQADRIADPA
jgi:hypothetical protein